ncbi:MAG TPA: GGDEF domain-containing protein [Patescibacteria group bacterium]|nr:GGDEF domain-containing protein [Patescibacteria group bacterium]
MLPSFALDIWTIVLLLFITNALLSLLYLQYFRGSETTSAVDRLWLLSRITLAAAWLGLMLRGLLPDLISVAVASGLLFAGFACECLVLLSFARSNLKLWQLYYAAVITSGAFFFFWQYQSFSNLRIFAASAIVCAIYIPAGVKLIITPDISRICRTLGYMIVSFSSVILLRMYVSLDYNSTFYLWTQSNVQTMTFLVAFLFTLTCGIGFLLISRENLDRVLFRESRTDYLTGLPNRRAFFARAEKQFRYCRQANRDITYMVIDIDHFKTINDQFGHDTGDAVLRRFSGLLSDTLRAADIPVRLGGDEFGVLLPETGPAEAQTAAERILAQPHSVSTPAGTVNYTLSIGITSATGPELALISFETLQHCGDQGLYSAKNHGRNQIAHQTCSAQQLPK